MNVAIVDYGSGNLHSASKAFERAARERGITANIQVTPDPDTVRRAERIVLPGVGAFADCRDGLKAVDGMWEALEDEVKGRGKPFLGICVGMQLLADRGLEFATTEGFGWIGGDVARIEPQDEACKIPHMGWNTIEKVRDHPVLEGIETGKDGAHAYFVHSFHLEPRDKSDVVAYADYGGPVTALVAKDNIVATQFHPEKSQTLGLALIANFLTWTP